MTKFINNITDRQFIFLTSLCFAFNTINVLINVICKESLVFNDVSQTLDVLEERGFVELFVLMNKNQTFNNVSLCILIISNILLLFLATILFCKSGCLKRRIVLFRFFLTTTIISSLCVIYEIIYSIKINALPSIPENLTVWETNSQTSTSACGILNVWLTNIGILQIAEWIILIVGVFSAFLFLFAFIDIDAHYKTELINKGHTNYKFLVLLLTPLLALCLFFCNEKKELNTNSKQLLKKCDCSEVHEYNNEISVTFDLYRFD